MRNVLRSLPHFHLSLHVSSVERQKRKERRRKRKEKYLVKLFVRRCFWHILPPHSTARIIRFSLESFSRARHLPIEKSSPLKFFFHIFDETKTICRFLNIWIDEKGNWMKFYRKLSTMNSIFFFSSSHSTSFPISIFSHYRMKVPFRIWLKTASSRTISCTFASRRRPSRTSRCRFARGACPTPTSCWMLRWLWIRGRQCSLAVFLVRWKLVSWQMVSQSLQSFN